MRFFDLHCDTLSEAYHRILSPQHNTALMLSFDRAPGASYTQIMAIWCRNTLDDDEAFYEFLAISDWYRTTIAPLRDGASLPDGASPDDASLRDNAAMRDNAASAPFKTLLAVEDARLLGGDLARLDVLADAGVSLLTLTWQGRSIIGGAWDTDEGLTPFGRLVVRSAAEKAIVLDLSHASDPLFDEVLSLTDEVGGQVVASHSCARALCPHRRNLTDAHFRALAARGGLVGVNFVPRHLRADGKASLTDVRDHLLHFLSLDAPGGAKALAIGSDFDGMEEGPLGLTCVEAMEALGDCLLSALPASLVDDILYANAARFFFTKESKAPRP